MLDLEDLLSDVLPNAEETVYAVVEMHEKQPSSTLPLRLATSDATAKTLRVRVITPELAQSNTEAMLPISTHVPTTCTLQQLKGLVQEHLGFPTEDGDCPELECNCSLARQIDGNATFNVNGSGDHDALRTVILVHSNNIVTAIPVGDITLNAIQQATKEYMEHTQNQSLANKYVNVVNGIEDTSIRTPGDRKFLKAPVMAICSKQCHSHRHGREEDSGDSEDDEDPAAHRDLVVDVHTSECPIEITAHNANITIEVAGLEDCAVNGVLNIYAVQRWTLGREERVDQGKAGIFKESEAWKHHVGQTDRGIASMLSTLRVFTELTANGSMEDDRRDAVLHMVHLLTQFPPAIRAAHILMRGETPGLPERAALAQCLYEILKNVVPLQTIRSDPKRFFEGSRLLFGLILEKAKQMKITTEDAGLPYIGMKVYDLRNLTTMQPVLSQPVQTTFGLVDAGFHEAFVEQGLLCWTDGDSSKRTSTVDQTWDRIAKVSGGTKTQVLVFNSDVVRSSSRYVDGGDINKIISPAEYVDLTYLANLCSRNQLSVTPPASLASASPPVLTLDRNGFLAVYVGRAACAEAGRDILLFRPGCAEEEEAVDVSIITQLLEPILTQRKADGTIVFESYGDNHRMMTAPDEVTMICVDLSASMKDRCGFDDVQTSEDAHIVIRRATPITVAASQMPPVENDAFELPDVDALKEYMKSHESYTDFLAIIATGKDDYHRRQNAEKVLEILKQLDDQQLETKRTQLETFRQQASQWYYRTEFEITDREINVLNNRSLRLQKYKSLLCAWLIVCLGNASASDPLMWRPGGVIPKLYKSLPPTDSPTFEVPRDFSCPISNDVMQDPVTTVDGFTYERKEIERWLRTNERSPCTNLILPSNDLRPNVQKKEQIDAYLNGKDIFEKYAQSINRTRASSRTTRIAFRSPIETRSMDVPHNLKAVDLWELAFRLTKGRYTSYELQHRNARVQATQEPITDMINTAHEVFITPLEPTVSNKSSDIQELCLVKVYHHSDYKNSVVSYWLPKQTTNSIASTVFKYYRQRFMNRSSCPVGPPFFFWTNLQNTGDGHHTGSTEDHWEPISQFFNNDSCTGRLEEEEMIDDFLNDDNSDDTGHEDTARGNHPLVFKIGLGRQPGNRKSRYRNTLSRLDVLKQMFDAYVNRLLAYNFRTHLGLVTFSTKSSVTQKITHAVENFRHKLNNTAAAGDTAIWDSIALAQDQLQEYAKQYSNAKLRIICISDGEDNRSTNKAHSLPTRLLRDGIVVDSFCLGAGVNNADLKRISFLTGGYVFQPKTLEEAMAICEMEPVLSLSERPDRSHKGSIFRRAYLAAPDISNFRVADLMGKVEQVSRDEFPDRKQHPQLAESFVELGLFNRSSSVCRTDSNVRLSRIHNEIRNSGAKPHPHYDVFICESNMGLWKIVMQGPSDSTYSGGTFLLYLEMGDRYPMSPPEARFITPIYHPNINRHGRICHSILDRNWTLDTSTKDVIDTIYSLLLVPEFSDPINTVVTLNYHWDEVQFKEEAQRHIEKHASKSRATWRSEIVG
ncbi:hypothetical protein J4E81_010999 [Alternaria sp. BMP 2799]|nr:hypothetical protein J4E81_010999 [Alternaria sp. BMP 2799]